LLPPAHWSATIELRTWVGLLAMKAEPLSALFPSNVVALICSELVDPALFRPPPLCPVVLPLIVLFSIVRLALLLLMPAPSPFVLWPATRDLLSVRTPAPLLLIPPPTKVDPSAFATIVVSAIVTPPALRTPPPPALSGITPFVIVTPWMACPLPLKT
jgi:hypothetical protein